MILWRLFFAAPFLPMFLTGSPFLISGIAAGVLVYGYRRSIVLWPLYKYLRFHNYKNIHGEPFTPFPKLPKQVQVWKEPEEKRPEPPKYWRYRTESETYYPKRKPAYKKPEPPHVEKTEEMGRDSKYKPWKLKKVSLELTDKMHGTPGAGLSDSGFDKSSIKAGQKGEENFAKALQMNGLMEEYESFWSVALPDENMRQMDETDIDAILLNDKKVFLIDLKNYRQGDLTYYNRGEEIYALDNKTGKKVGASVTATGQMERASKNFEMYLIKQGLANQIEVVPMVVFMPTDRGIGNVVARWPGGIPAYTLEDAIDIIKKGESSGNLYSREQKLVKKLDNLTK